MRKIIAAIAIIAALTSCGSGATEKSTKKADTTRTLGIYNLLGEYKLDSVFRITRDTFKLAEVGEKTADLEWVRDTLYFIPVVVDTARKEIRWYGLAPQYVQEVTVQPILK